MSSLPIARAPGVTDQFAMTVLAAMFGRKEAPKGLSVKPCAKLRVASLLYSRHCVSVLLSPYCLRRASAMPLDRWIGKWLYRCCAAVPLAFVMVA